MGKVIEGSTILLNTAIEVPEYNEVYLVQVSSGWNWDEMCKIDLGRKRILHVERESYLVLVNEDGITFDMIEFPPRTDFSEDTNGENHPMIKMVDYLKSKDISCKTLVCSLKNLEKDSKKGMFSKFGYFMQDSSWGDGWTYACDLVLAKNQLVVSGRSVNYFSVSHSSWISTNIEEKMHDDILKILKEPVFISEEKFHELLECRGLKDIYKYFDVEYYE